VTVYDLARFVTEPPVQYMRLYHPRLPWYIDVTASDPVGATLQELFARIHKILSSPISASDFFNTDVTDQERGKITMAWRERCQYNKELMSQGVKRVDFLMKDCIFIGLAKGKEGMWEIKTRKC